jgi:L-lactate permease
MDNRIDETVQYTNAFDSIQFIAVTTAIRMKSMKVTGKMKSNSNQQFQQNSESKSVSMSCTTKMRLIPFALMTMAIQIKSMKATRKIKNNLHQQPGTEERIPLAASRLLSTN